MRLMVYSHDTFGLGNIRRMVEICQYLLKEIPGLSVLLVTGSPMIQSFRLPPGLDYIKLPSLNRGKTGKLSARHLRIDVKTIVKLRSDLILAGALCYKPDIMLIDKKPSGVKGELADTLNSLKTSRSQTKLVLLLRDILDLPQTTRAEWEEEGYHRAIHHYFHKILVVGDPNIFNLCHEYGFPAHVAEKLLFCGYLRKEPGQEDGLTLRQRLNIKPCQKLILVTPGGGEDGFPLLSNYLQGQHLNNPKFHSLVFCGPEMPAHEQLLVHEMAAQLPHVTIREFTDDMMSYVNAADLVVSMCGYNTITEVLSLEKRAITLPRIKPGHEQFIRATRLADLDLLHQINPCELTPERLSQAVTDNLRLLSSKQHFAIDFNGLSRIRDSLLKLLIDIPGPNPSSQINPINHSGTLFLRSTHSPS